MKKLTALLIFALLISSLIGCSKPTPSAETPAETPIDTPIEPPVETTTPELKTMDDKTAYSQTLLEDTLNQLNVLEEVYTAVYSNDGVEMWIQVTQKGGTEFIKKIGDLENDFSKNGKLNDVNQQEWNAIVNSLQDLYSKVNKDVHENTTLQLLGTKDQVILQIDTKNGVMDHLKK